MADMDNIYQQPAVMLNAQAIQASWGRDPVLCDFSLEVMRGELVCLMGVNGCGKSTFLDCILGELKPERGSIYVQGRELAELKAYERAKLFSYVPQKRERSFPYTVEHVVLMGRTVHQSGFGVPDDDDRSKVKEALAICGIKHLAFRSCTQLSGGEMQMVLLARALVQDTPLILLDEPTTHLDFKNELLFLETIEQLIKTKEVSALMATHAPNQVFHLAAAGLKVKVALMAQGSIAACGLPEEVLTPGNLAKFFGVSACMMIQESGTEFLPGLRQIVPLTVIDKKKEEGFK